MDFTIRKLLIAAVAIVCFPFWAGVQPSQAADEQPERRDRKSQWVWQNPQTPAGTVHKTFSSAALSGKEVSYLFWAPPGYDPADATKRYPVAYFLHGGGGGYTHIPETFLPQAEKAIRAGEVPPFIGIVVNGLAGSFYMDSADGPVETILMKELLPHIDATYPTSGVRLIEGFSMGGRGASYLGFKYPDKFRGVVNCSGAIHDWEFFQGLKRLGVADKFGDEAAFVAAWPFTLAKKNADEIRKHFPAGAFIAVGDADTGRGNTYQWCTKLHETLKDLKIPTQLHVAEGVKHSYERLAVDPEVAKAHLAYYASVFKKESTAK